MPDFRVWWYDEFKDCDTAEERDEIAWKVPPYQSLLFPERFTPCDDVDDAATQYADYFFNQRDGYENSWPVEFVVHDGERFHLVSVELDYEPSFTAGEPRVLDLEARPK